MTNTILHELKHHAPFTAFGAVTGIGLIVIMIFGGLLSRISNYASVIFYILHPTHIVLSGIVTTAIYRLHKPRSGFITAIIIGYAGSLGIATLSDSIIPYVGEWLLQLENRGIHLGFIEEPWLTHPAAILGITIAFIRPVTKFPHSGHVLISTWASLFHILMAIGSTLGWIEIVAIFFFLFLAIWIPCCLSDIVFPLLFVPANR